MRIGTVRMAHVTGDGIGAAERLVIMKNAFAFRNEAIGRFFPDLLVTLGKGAVGLELTPGGSASARLLGRGRRFGRCDNPFGIGMFAPPFLHERVGDLLALLARQLIAWFDVFDLDRSFAVAESDNQITVWGRLQLMARRIVSG
jgi:hypothetical protein